VKQQLLLQRMKLDVTISWRRRHFPLAAVAAEKKLLKKEA
jgi:hypothetical protein